MAICSSLIKCHLLSRQLHCPQMMLHSLYLESPTCSPSILILLLYSCFKSQLLPSGKLSLNISIPKLDSQTRPGSPASYSHSFPMCLLLLPSTYIYYTIMPFFLPSPSLFSFSLSPPALPPSPLSFFSSFISSFLSPSFP